MNAIGVIERQQRQQLASGGTLSGRVTGNSGITRNPALPVGGDPCLRWWGVGRRKSNRGSFVAPLLRMTALRWVKAGLPNPAMPGTLRVLSARVTG